MIRRFVYHAFWNFYDHMGTLLLWGTCHALLALGLVVASIGLAGYPGRIISVAVLAGLVQFALLVLVLAALLPYCARTARGEPARWRHISEGIKKYWSIVARILAVVVVVISVLLVNLNFYLPLQDLVVSPSLKLLLIFVVAIIGWSCLVLFVLLAPWLCAGTAAEEKITAREALKKAFMAGALIPGTWILIAILGAALFVAGLYTRIGLVFLVPVLVSFSQTAYELAVQYSKFIGSAKEELGTQTGLRQLKKRASELSWEWEYAQPRRTFKELIRPWEY